MKYFPDVRRPALVLSAALSVGAFALPLGFSDSKIALAQHKHNLQGKIEGDRYYAFGNAFNILLPSHSEASQIEDSYAAPNLGGVAFFNDAGFLLKIEVDELIPEARAMITKHPEIKDEMLEAIFHDALLVQILQNVPKGEVLYGKNVKLENGDPAYFAVLDLPGAATLMDLNSGRSLDSKRGYLLFFANDKEMISMSLQDTLTFIPSIAHAAMSRLNERLLNHLLHYQATMVIPPAPVSS